MALNKKTVTKILQSWINEGLYVSLHVGEPSSSGVPTLFGPVLVRSGIRATNGRIENTSLLTLGESNQGGRATHIGIWLGRSNFLGSSKLNSPVLVAIGTTIQVPRYGLKVSFGE